ncbi:MAG: hypothetical protein Q9182_005464 [Xanthomendoza sp. 2 TL-2023]
MNIQSYQSTFSAKEPDFNCNPVVIGLYGVSGCGKTFLLNQLKHKVGEEDFLFYDGSQAIEGIVPGGLEHFQKMEEQEQTMWRQRAIDDIGEECIEIGQAAIVAGHSMLWSEAEADALPVYTQNDLDVYSHILYLNVPAEVIAQRRAEDAAKDRPNLSVDQLRAWQQKEIKQLRALCRTHGILFLVLHQQANLDGISTLLHDFRVNTEEHNFFLAKRELDGVFEAGEDLPKTMLVIDADRTLAAEDTGALFWAAAHEKSPQMDGGNTLKALFSGPLGYSYTAFRQATLLYEETFDEKEFEDLCQQVSSRVTMYPEMVSLLQVVAEQEHIGVVVASSGLRRVWEKVLMREGLSRTVKIVSGGRLGDGFVVTAAVKTGLVAHLQDQGVHVWAFGDSPLDLGMLSKADEAIVVVGDERTRSKTMDAELMTAMNAYGLQARQAVLPSNALPRTNSKLPVVKLTDSGFLNDVLKGQSTHTGPQVHHVTDKNAAKLLATPMRNSAVAGPALREAHRQAGQYLAREFVAEIIGLESAPIQHVLGRPTSGYQLCREKQTTIVALMRGGEPMASGVNDVFPLAMFVHAKATNDLKIHHLDGQVTLILVDSVINTGKTIVDFVKHVRKLHATIRIVVISGVIQAQCVSGSNGGSLVQNIASYACIHIIGLRLSQTSFVGSRQTDTGNRLFNTTHLA